MLKVFILPTILFVISRGCSGEIPHPRIVGGRQVAITEFPYMVSVQSIYRQHNCGGVLISDSWVLTAGHCTYLNEDSYYVRAGSTYCEKGGQLIMVASIITHPLYLETKQDNDIALLKLMTPVKYEGTQAIKLSSKLVLLSGAFVTISSWGSTEDDNEIKERLMAAQIKVHSKERCRRGFPHFNITDSMFCAGGNGQNTCSFDSGGPAVLGKYLVGITIVDKTCGYPSYPGVYLKVQKYLPWIKYYTGISES